MRTTIAIGAFLAVAAGAVGVGAAIDLKGSDTLKEFTRDILGNPHPVTGAPDPFADDCGGTGNTPAGGITYIGTGSTNGQAALLGAPPQQFVAPMSRALNSGICGTMAAPNPDLPTSEGIVFALDGLSIFAAKGNGTTTGFSSTACNGTVSSSCVVDTSVGMVLNKTVTPDAARTCPGGTAAECNVGGVSGEVCNAGVCQYTFTDWRNVLRVLYFGMNVPFGATGGGGALADIANRNCASPERKFLANNWSNVFQGACTNGQCSGTGDGFTGATTADFRPTNGIKHLFARNLESGTTDVFLTLLGASSMNSIGANQSPFCNSGTKGPLAGVAFPAPASYVQPGPAETNSGPLPNAVANHPNAACEGDIGGSANPPNGTSPRRYFAPEWVDFQDCDVIRRRCSGNGLLATTQGEDVCSIRGDLGLLLQIYDAPVMGAGETAFPDQACATGAFAALPNNLKRNNCTNHPNCWDECPNLTQEGAGCGLFAAGTCAYPTRASASSALDPRCYNSRGNVLAAELACAPVAVGGGTPTTLDGRVYNLHVFTEVTAGSFQHAITPRLIGQSPLVGTGPITSAYPPTVNTPMIGAYYRLHQSHTLNLPLTSPITTCRQDSASNTIGCLVQASPCSMGFSGAGAGGFVAPGTTGNIALKLNGVDAQTQCVQNFISETPVGGTYPFSRKLYINTTKGFETVAGLGGDGPDQAKLAKCYANSSPGHPLIHPGAIVAADFTTLGESPFCEDFVENATGSSGCNAIGVGTNANACGNNVAAGFPDSRAGTCGVTGAACTAPGTACTGSRGAGTCQSTALQGCICK